MVHASRCSGEGRRRGSHDLKANSFFAFFSPRHAGSGGTATADQESCDSDDLETTPRPPPPQKRQEQHSIARKRLLRPGEIINERCLVGVPAVDAML